MGHADPAMVGQLAVELAFRLAVSSIDLPSQEAYVRPQIVDVPVPGRGTVQVAV